MHFTRLTVALERYIIDRSLVDSYSSLLLLFIVKYLEITIHRDKQIFVAENKEYSHALHFQLSLEVIVPCLRPRRS